MTKLNLASLILGLIAWILPVMNLARRNKAENKSWIVFAVSSISACAISLFFQIVYQNHLVNIEDWPAIMDTTHGLVVVSSVLLAMTILLNMITLVKYMRK